MIMVWFWTIISVLLVGLASLLGVLSLSIKKATLQKILIWLVSFATGALFGDVFLHLLPEIFEEIGNKKTLSFFILTGILLFFILEKIVRWHHCHLGADQHHKPIVVMNLVGDGVHNFIDGMLIGASYLVNPSLGLATTLAIIFHEIPQEIGDFGILVHGGLSVEKALFYNFLSSLTALAGALISLIIGSKVSYFSLYLLPIAAGGFLYIAGSDLVPELQHDVEIKKTMIQLAIILSGIGIMALIG